MPGVLMKFDQVQSNQCEWTDLKLHEYQILVLPDTENWIYSFGIIIFI